MGTHKILVADDNMDAAATLAALLSLEGHEVRCAHDGLEALRVYEEFAPDVVMLDISMPRLDGLEVARRIRARKPARRVLLLALWGWARRRDAESSIACGFDYHLNKPVEFKTVSQLL